MLLHSPGCAPFPPPPPPLTYPTRSSVHLPQCPAPKPSPALAPGMPRAVSRLSSRSAWQGGFSPTLLLSPPVTLTTSQPHRLIHGEDRLRAASQHAVRDSAPPLPTPSHFQAASRSGDYNSQQPSGDNGGARGARGAGGPASGRLHPPSTPPARLRAKSLWRELRAFGRASPSKQVRRPAR